MAIYTVFEPPETTGDRLSDSDRFVFVPHKFSIGALVIPLIWLPYRRMWLILLAYLAIVVVLEGFTQLYGGPAPGIIATLFSLLFAFEAQALRRWTLRRRGWRELGIVAGQNQETAEWRFFTQWLDERPPPPRHTKTMPQSTSEPAVIGMFPEPET